MSEQQQNKTESDAQTYPRFTVREYEQTWCITSSVSGLTIQRKVCSRDQANRITEILNESPNKEKQ